MGSSPPRYARPWWGLLATKVYGAERCACWASRLASRASRNNGGLRPAPDHLILMLAGALGLLLSLLFWSSFSPWSRRRTVARGDTVIEERRIERDLP